MAQKMCYQNIKAAGSKTKVMWSLIQSQSVSLIIKKQVIYLVLTVSIQPQGEKKKTKFEAWHKLSPPDINKTG